MPTGFWKKRKGMPTETSASLLSFSLCVPFLLRPHQVLEPDVHAEDADDIAFVVGDRRRDRDAERAGDLGGVEVRDEAFSVLHRVDEPGAVREVVAQAGGLVLRLVR